MYNIYTYIYVDYAIEAIIIRGSSKQNIERHNLIPEENNKKVNRQLTLLDVQIVDMKPKFTIDGYICINTKQTYPYHIETQKLATQEGKMQ